ncbi:MAG: alkaline phosphatase [Saprospiraceae bacterium]|nr:alkaline phosphatase [Saprospiraceae bacterium]
MKKLLFGIAFFTVFLSCNQYPQPIPGTGADLPKIQKHPKNVILLIGDGMGLTQISAALYSNDNRLNLEKFPIVGLHKSYSSNDLITDSAAGATAFASGVKTYNGAIGVNQDSMSVKTILEEAEDRGLATGLVATSSITHATPACFIAHVKSRADMQDIAEDFIKTEIDLFIGGGKKYFDRREKDTRDLYKELEAKGYRISDFLKEDLQKVTIDFSKNFGYFTADAEPLPFSQGRDYLVPASKLAPIFLEKRSSKGFFLMIEGSQIDWGGHANDSKYIISEAIEFDNAIGAILEYAKEDGETLVIVTADHETGGYAINTGSKMGEIVGAFTTDKHTAALIPVYAFGPGAELFAGIYENTAIYDKMRMALGFKGQVKSEATTSK